MTAPAAYFEYPGIYGFRSGNYTLKPGTEPGVIWIYSPDSNLHGRIPKRGTITLVYGASRLQLVDCTLDSVDKTVAADGTRMLAFKFFDRRHRWPYGFIEGEYNVREGEEGVIKESTKRSARELAGLCFGSMLEARAAFGVMPKDQFPEISWSGLPVDALNELCDWASCRVVFDPFANRTALHRIGVGKPLPPGPVKTDQYSLDTPELPDSFAFLTEPVWFEMDIELEAVIEDPDEDDKLTEIDKVAWRPKDGWGTTGPPRIATVAAKHAERAKQQLYRWYRPKLPIKDWGFTIDDLWRILPLQTNRVGVHFLDADDENREQLGAALFGEFVDGHESGNLPKADTRTTDGLKAEWERDFSIDAERGLVMLGEMGYRLIDAKTGRNVAKYTDSRQTQTKPAKLWLRVAVQVRDEDTGSPIRWRVSQKTPGKRLGTAPHVLTRPDVRLVKWHKYSAAGTVDKDNLSSVEELANAVLIDEINAFTTKESGTRSYPGLLAFTCDGAISQITWSVDDSGHSSTTISREKEQLGAALSMEQSRHRAALRRLVRDNRRRAFRRERNEAK